MKATLRKDISINGGPDRIPQGTEVTVNYDHATKTLRCTQINGRFFRLRSLATAHKYLTGFKKEPSLAKLEKMVDSGPCSSIRGKYADPDGYDTDGFPSWLIVLGMI